MELVSEIARERIAPQAAEFDRSGDFPRESLRLFGELPGLVVAEKDGGIGAGRTCLASLVQELARACASTPLIYTSHVVAEKGRGGARGNIS